MELLKDILPHLNSIIALIAVWFMRKWLRLQIQASQVQGLLDAITEEIVEVERKPGLSGAARKSEVIERIIARFQAVSDPVFTPMRRSLLKKVFGSLEVTVERAFQLSHLALKRGTGK